MNRRWLIPLVFCLLLIAPVLAIDTLSQAQSVSSYSVVAEPGYVIYQIIIDPIAMGSNQSHLLNYNGANFLLTIGSAQSYVIFNDFDVALTYPNGTTSSKHIGTTRMSGGTYKTTIQPVFTKAQSLTNTYLVIDLQVGLSPVSAEFNTQPAGWSPSSAIPFSSASGNLGATTNVFVYQTTIQEFQENILDYNPIYGVTSLANVVFQWTWSMVLGFLNMIPIIGPLMITFLTLSGVILPELFFWLIWIAENFLAILLAVETLILLFAVINAGKGKRSFSRLFKNIYWYNVEFLSGVFTFVERIRGWVISIVEVIQAIVQALKPI